jgi:hypothetical protein
MEQARVGHDLEQFVERDEMRHETPLDGVRSETQDGKFVRHNVPTT